MKILQFTGLMVLVLTGSLLVTRGEDYRTDINPALVYYRAFLVHTEPISEADWNYLASKKGKEQKLPEQFRQVVTNSDHQFVLVHQAAHAQVPCDWGIDLSPGPNIMLPHLARAKAVCQIAQIRARWALEHGQQNVACEDLVSALVLGRNLPTDGLLISALVQYAIEALDYATVAQHFGQFSPEVLKQLVDGFDAAPARHSLASCMPSEKTLGGWLERKVLELKKAYPNDDAKVMAEFGDSGIVTAMDFLGNTNFWPRLLAATGGKSDELLKLLGETEPLFPRLAEIMALPQSEYDDRAKEFLGELRKSPNPFFSQFAFMLDKWQNGGIRAREFRGQAQLAMIHAAVEYKLHGESGFKSVMDPFGNGPFGFRRFVFKGVDRGFELKSAYAGTEAPFVMIFVEKPGAAFEVVGPKAGTAITK